MAIMITDECIVCGACEIECPNHAIYEQGASWKWSDGTALSGTMDWEGNLVDTNRENEAISEDYYYIVPGKCTECKGFHDEPQCAAVCPVDCCIPDPSYRESGEILIQRKNMLHC